MWIEPSCLSPLLQRLACSAALHLRNRFPCVLVMMYRSVSPFLLCPLVAPFLFIQRFGCVFFSWCPHPSSWLVGDNIPQGYCRTHTLMFPTLMLNFGVSFPFYDPILASSPLLPSLFRLLPPGWSTFTRTPARRAKQNGPAQEAGGASGAHHHPGGATLQVMEVVRLFQV